MFIGFVVENKKSGYLKQLSEWWRRVDKRRVFWYAYTETSKFRTMLFSIQVMS